MIKALTLKIFLELPSSIVAVVVGVVESIYAALSSVVGFLRRQDFSADVTLKFNEIFHNTAFCHFK